MGFRLAVNSPQLVVSKPPEVRPQHRHRQRFSKFKLAAVLGGQFNVMEVHMMARHFRDFLRDASLAVKRRSPLWAFMFAMIQRVRTSPSRWWRAGSMSNRRALRTAALSLLQLSHQPPGPEGVPLRRWLDSWTGLGFAVRRMRRFGYDVDLSHERGR